MGRTACTEPQCLYECAPLPLLYESIWVSGGEAPLFKLENRNDICECCDWLSDMQFR